MRIWDAVKIDAAINTLLKDNEQVDAIDWLSDPVNIALENEQGDIALFEYGLPHKKIYSGHYIFKSRGKAAIQAARDFLDEIFNSCYNISIVMGLTPVEYRAAKWLTRRIGFTSYGIEEIRGKQYELFILTKKEFENG